MCNANRFIDWSCNLMTYVNSVLDHFKDSSMSFSCKAKDMATTVQQPQNTLPTSVSTLGLQGLWGPPKIHIDQGHAPPSYHSLGLFLSISSTNVWIIAPFGNPINWTMHPLLQFIDFYRKIQWKRTSFGWASKRPLCQFGQFNLGLSNNKVVFYQEKFGLVDWCSWLVDNGPFDWSSKIIFV